MAVANTMYRVVVSAGLLLAFTWIVEGYNNGVSRLPPMGWNTWCTYGDCAQSFEPHPDPNHDICNAPEIMSVADAMSTNGMKEKGWMYINLDDCWTAINRTTDGNIQADPTRFPDGLEPVIQHVHSLGLKFGLYTSAGDTTCNTHGHPVGTWPRHGSFGHYKEDTATFASWGVDYVKIDWCGNKFGYDAETLHTNFSHWLNQTGRPMHLELCRGYTMGPGSISAYVSKVAQSWRVAGDNQDNWEGGTDKTIESFVNNSRLGGPYGWNYGDFLTTGGAGCSLVPPPTSTGPYLHCPGQTEEEYRTQFSVYALAASPLIVATDIRNMTSCMQDILLNEEIIAINQQTNTPGDVVGNLPVGKDRVQVWTRDIEDGSGVYVGIVNFNNNTQSATVPLAMISSKWTDKSTVTLRDLWARKQIGSITGSLQTTIKAHDTAVFSLKPMSL
eukprot:m.120525 g.120525  ORF g.120525 m.120525 type:complete len:443 (+) comp14365_c0_seq1:108-1436(+)